MRDAKTNRTTFVGKTSPGDKAGNKNDIVLSIVNGETANTEIHSGSLALHLLVSSRKGNETHFGNLKGYKPTHGGLPQ